MHSEPTPAAATCRLPFYDRGGVAGYALVDPEDYERFHAWRWHLKNGYVSNQRQKGKHPNATYTRTYLHRAVLNLKQGDGWVVDHVSRDRLDNRKSNLRICDQSVNARNSERRAENRSASGFKNVYWDPDHSLWLVSVKWRGQKFFFRRYRTKEEAIAVAHTVRFCLDATEPKAVGS